MSSSTMFKNYMTLAKQKLDENASIHADIRTDERHSRNDS